MQLTCEVCGNVVWIDNTMTTADEIIERLEGLGWCKVPDRNVCPVCAEKEREEAPRAEANAWETGSRPRKAVPINPLTAHDAADNTTPHGDFAAGRRGDTMPMVPARGLADDLVDRREKQLLEDLLEWTFSGLPRQWIAVRHVVLDGCSFGNAAKYLKCSRRTAFRLIKQAGETLRNGYRTHIGRAVLNRLCPSLPRLWRTDAGEAVT